MSEEMLKDPDANHTKSIENFFGNLDREVCKAGSQVFDKAASDLVIKYSKDLIATGHVWHKKENRMAAKEISIKQTNFDHQQKDFAFKGNRQSRCSESVCCKQGHQMHCRLSEVA